MNTVKDISISEHANAVCAICRLPTRVGGGTLTPAAAIRTWRFASFYVCAHHAAMAGLSDRLLHATVKS